MGEAPNKGLTGGPPRVPGNEAFTRWCRQVDKWLHRIARDVWGGVADGGLSPAAVREQLSGTSPIDYTESTGVIALTESAIDHGGISGLGDDDHPHYHTDARALTWLGTRSTTDLPEGTNQYYTQARFDTAFAAKSTTDLSEGTNLYYTQSRFDTALAAAVGVTVQAFSALLSAIAALTATKGNLIAADGSTWTALGVGSTGQVLTPDSGETAGLKWSSPGVGAEVSPAQLTADVNDYDPGDGGLVRVSSDASRTITGLAPSGGSFSGRALYLVNVGANDVVLANESASSTAANRIINKTGADLTLSADGTAVLIYDGTTQRWRVF